jgi:twitching motility protein PilT
MCNRAHIRPQLRITVALVDSLLSAIVRAEGDALVMHVGERPYVVVGTQTINISTHGLNLDAMTGMLTQLLPADSQTQLEEFGAVEYRIPQQGDDRFTVVAARGGDDIWIEIRRRRPQAAVAAAVETPKPQVAAPVVELVAQPVEPVASVETESYVITNAQLEPVVVASAEIPETPIVQSEPIAMEVVAAVEVPVGNLFAELEACAEPVADVSPEAFAALDAQLEMAAVMPPQDLPAFLMPMPAGQAVVEPSVIEPVVVARLPVVEEAIAVEGLTAVEAPIVVEEPLVVEQPMIAVEARAPIEEPPVVEAPAPERIFETEIAATVIEPTPEPVVPERVEAPTSVPLAQPERIAAPEPASIAEPEPMPIAASIAAPEPMPAGVVLPMTRTVRIEVPPRTSSRGTTGIDRLMRIAAARGASALFLTSDSRPWIRIEGDLRHLDSEATLSRADVESAILEIAPESHESIGKGEPTEWIAEFADVGRIRCTTFSDHRGPGVLLRMIATRAATAEQLGLAREVQALATEPQGIVLIAGPRAGGKSTLISALVDLVNRQRAEFVITLERQIRLVHDNKSALVSQREIRGGADDSVAAARAALRESPDVLVVDDLVSPHMVPLLLTAASEGLLVFVSITAPSTADAVQRFIELAPAEMRKAVQSAMAESFRGAVAQLLLKKAGGGLLAAREVLLATAPVTRVISEGQLGQLPLALESGRKHGMVSFTDALVDSVRNGTVDLREAFRKAPDRSRLLDSLKREKIDTSVVERLA